MFPPPRTLFAAFALVAFSIAAGAVARADPIVTSVGTANGGSGINSTQYNLVQFTLGNSYTGVSIAASLISTAAGRTGTAYLTTQVGPGTTAASQLASTGFTFAVVPNVATVSYVNLFSGLSLGPGTYYVVFASTDPDGGFITAGAGVTYATAPGTSVGPPQFSSVPNINPGYPPASTFQISGLGNRFFTVAGTSAPTAVPEPATMLLLGTGLTSVIGAARRRRQARQ